MSRAAPVPAVSAAAHERAQPPISTDRTIAQRLAHALGLAQANSLARRFLLASLLVLGVGGVVIGWWVGNQLERGIIDRSASITGLYVDSIIEPHLATLASGEWLNDRDIAALDELLTNTAFAEDIVALKIWRPDGVIEYSPDRSLVGQAFPVEGDLAAALKGTVVSEMSSLDDAENVNESALGYDRLLEMYLPIRERGGERIIAVAEFYQVPTELERQVADARLQSWLVVALAVALAYLLLYGIVRQGSETIDHQRVALETQVSELSALLNQNEQLRQRVRVAAERTTTLSERNLRRISSDLHDGPAQMLALAMLRLDQLRARGASDKEVEELQSTLSDALRDMRAVAAGLRLPELESLSTADVVRRGVDDHERRTSVPVTVTLGELPREASLPTKIALFRALQELLSNSTRHGGGKDVEVSLVDGDGALRMIVADGGPGFAQTLVGVPGHLGLAGVREQAELLGGTFTIDARAGGGARVTVAWPL
ncbi:MAG TPA: sensor histidine kinase [Candidatus Limnocylindrales bacterium]|nr:sensor histidine kinase [Candidatus Limnocylindrales bacterium]